MFCINIDGARCDQTEKKSRWDGIFRLFRLVSFALDGEVVVGVEYDGRIVPRGGGA